MKVCIIGDLHWSRTSSILRGRGKNFSLRLEGLIKTLNWIEDTSKQEGCEEEIFLGDFFDKSELNAEEISALSEIEWNKTTRLKHFLVGNHDSAIASHIYNSAQALSKVGVIEDTPYIYPLDDKTEILFLPYISEEDRKPFIEYTKGRNPNKKLIVCSHNDIKNFQMGPFLSKIGFEKQEIDSNCDLYLNGHLHNCGQVTEKIINVGNCTGANFSEDAIKYEHHIYILNTDTGTIETRVNPYAFNFYKFSIMNKADLKLLDLIKGDAIVSFTCLDTLEPDLLAAIETKQNIITYKVIYKRADTDAVKTDDITIERADHLKQFYDFILGELPDENQTVLVEELTEVCN